MLLARPLNLPTFHPATCLSTGILRLCDLYVILSLMMMLRVKVVKALLLLISTVGRTCSGSSQRSERRPDEARPWTWRADRHSASTSLLITTTSPTFPPPLYATMSELDAVHLPPSHASGDDSAIASSSAQPSGTATSGGDEIEADEDDDAELEAMKARVAEMEAEAAKLREMQEQAEREAGGSGGGKAAGGGGGGVVGPTDEEKEEVDARSVYVGNVSWQRQRQRPR